MPLLKKFTFSIDTGVCARILKLIFHQMKIFNLASLEEDMNKLWLIYSKSQQKAKVDVISINFHINSILFFYRSNAFHGGMFYNDWCLFMIDSRLLQRNFKVISQSFPILKNFYIHNDESQTDKQQSTTFMMFPHLILLNLYLAHVDYAEQFLIDKNCHVPRLQNLGIKYESLATVTHNFTNDATRLIGTKLTSLKINEPIVRLRNFDQYFPLL
jgi:hypothetical protein